MDGKQLCAALRGGRRVYGTAILSESPRWPMEIHRVGLDFVFIDTEHIPIDRGKLSWMCHAYRLQQLAPIVRIPSPDPYAAAMVLDGGASGIIAPYVENAEQVRALAGAVKLRPIKGERLRQALDGSQPFSEPTLNYINRRNEGNVLIINFESVPALSQLDDMLEVPGLDAILIGPHDLSCNMGLPEQYLHPDFDAIVKTVIRKSRSRGIGAGIHFWSGLDKEIEWAREGANLIMHSNDLKMFLDGMSRDIAYIKTQLGEGQDRREEDDGDTAHI